MGRYTERDDAVLDQLIEDHMGAIISSIRAEMEPTAIVLRGSFGRGEGSVYGPTGQYQFLSDYEIDVATYSPNYRAIFKKISHELTNQLGVETSLRWVRPDFLSKERIGPFVLGRAPVSISLYEERYGSRVLYGADFISESAGIDPGKIRLESGIYLVLNRMVESMLNMTPDKQVSEETLERYYWVNKSILACAEALLLLWGQYHYSYRERGKRFAALAPIKLDFLPDQGAALAGYVARATEFKLRPGDYVYREPLSETWDAIIPAIDLVFRHMVEQILQIKFEGYAEYPKKYLNAIAKRSSPPFSPKFLAFKLLDVYRGIRIRKLSRGVAGRYPIEHIVYAVAPMLFCSLVSEDRLEILPSARKWLSLIDHLEKPASEAQMEREYLQQRLTWLWKVYCYG